MTQDEARDKLDKARVALHGAAWKSRSFVEQCANVPAGVLVQDAEDAFDAMLQAVLDWRTAARELEKAQGE